jgi:hypothetical protein
MRARVERIALGALSGMIALSILAISVFICGPSFREKHIEAVRDGLGKLEPPRQMNRQYREVDHFITHYGFGDQPLQWQSKAYFEGRFSLACLVDVEVSYWRDTVTQVGEPRFILHALRSIDPSDLTGTYEGNLQREFGKAEWEKFVNSGFDLTTLGIPKKEIRPIPNWEAYVQGWRKDVPKIR